MNMKLTEAVIEDAKRHFRDGLKIRTVAGLLGVDRVTVHTWIRQGRLTLRGSPDAPDNPLYGRFAAEAELALGEWTREYWLEAQAAIGAGDVKRAQACLTMLARRLPGEYGQSADMASMLGEALARIESMELDDAAGDAARAEADL